MSVSEVNEAAADDLRTKLQPFLIRNPEAEVEARDERPVVVTPWGDDSIELRIESDGTELLNALNAVRLPPEFTAVWHEDNREFEVIYTATPFDNELLKRGFEFRFRDNTYTCSFGDASNRLLLIARAFRPLGPTRTDYRNLHSFYMYLHSKDDHPESQIVRQGKPTSFWIRGIQEYNSSDLIDLVLNLNFYMGYFDRETPSILVHEPTTTHPGHRHPDRYPSGLFPKVVNARDINQHLLILWESASHGDPFLHFIHYYQILEYAAFYHIRDDVMQTIQRVLTAPETPTRPHLAAQQILEAMVADKTQDDAKINEVIRRSVSAEELWEEIDAARSAFSHEVTFDGGFTLSAMVTTESGTPDLAQLLRQAFPNALHRIRNALVHARESRQSTMIAPTRANHDRIVPWLGPLSLTAARVMVHSNLQ